MTLLNRFFVKSLKIAGFLCFSFPVYANEICDSFYKTPKVSVKIDYGNVAEKSVPRTEILKFKDLKNPDATLGITRADFSIKYDFGFERYKINDGVCAVLSSINFTIGYKNIEVLIDDKYKEDSCEYNAISEHEQGHVGIYKRELKFYGNLILKELKRIAGDVGPMYFSEAVSEKKLGNKIQKMVFGNKNIGILKSKLSKALMDKNKAYDSSDEYTRVKGLCRSW